MSSGKRIKNILQTEKYLPEKESNGKKNFQELKGRQKGIRERGTGGSRLKRIAKQKRVFQNGGIKKSQKHG